MLTSQHANTRVKSVWLNRSCLCRLEFSQRYTDFDMERVGCTAYPFYFECLTTQKLLKPVDSFFNIFHRGCIGNPDVLIRSKRGAGDEGDMCLFE